MRTRLAAPRIMSFASAKYGRKEAYPCTALVRSKETITAVVATLRRPHQRGNCDFLPSHVARRGRRLCRHQSEFVRHHGQRWAHARPKLINTRTIWDRLALDRAFEALPDRDAVNPWDENGTEA